jgi:hypothetical protein
MGKPKDPDYWKKWRAAHPEYKERERERARARRANGERRDRSQEYRNRRVKERAAQAVQECLDREAQEHPLLMEAKEYVRRKGIRPDGRTHVATDYYDECVAEVVLSLLLGQRPQSGYVRAWRARKAWYDHNLTGWPDAVGLEGKRATR